jgi:hypothetical protein
MQKSSVIFQEWAFLPRPVMVCLGTISVIFVGIFVLALATAQGPWVAYALLAVLGIFLPLAIMTVHSRVSVIDGDVALQLWPLLRRQFSRQDVVSARQVQVSPLKDAGGYGWRLTGTGRRALVMHAGDGVEVTLQDGSTFLVGTRSAPALLEALGSS